MTAAHGKDATEEPWRIVADDRAQREGEQVSYEPAMGRPARFFIGSLMGPNFPDIDSLYLDAAMVCAALRLSGHEIDPPHVGWEQPRFAAGWSDWIELAQERQLRIAELDIEVPEWVFAELLSRQGWRVRAPEERRPCENIRQTHVPAPANLQECPSDSCVLIQTLIDNFAGGRCSYQEAQRVSSHCASCPNCRAIWSRIRGS